MQFKTIGILGAGHIGGSFAKAFRALPEPPTVLVGDTDEATRRTVLDGGWASAVFDPREQAPETAFASCDLVLFAMPPAAVAAMLPRFRGSRIPLLTDVCSVKGPVLAAAEGLGNFIGGHPMAGTEGVGFGAANPAMFRKAAFILCQPADYQGGDELFQAYRALLQALGFRLYEMDAATHDHRLALISHLPHIASFALAELAADEQDDLLQSLIGGGFRDTTRIAASAPGLWTDILRASPQLPEVVDHYIEKLQALRNALSAAVPPQQLYTALETAERYRRQIPDGLHKVPHATEEFPRPSFAQAFPNMKSFALIGHPLGHSLSPAIHQAIFEAAGIEGRYDLLDIPPEELDRRLPRLLQEYTGINVTIPHKQAVIPHLKALGEAARRCGAVNTITADGTGHNTDVIGFLSNNLPLKGGRVLLLGAGGTARMMAFETVAAGAASLTLSARHPARAQALAADLQAAFPTSRCKIELAETPEAVSGALASATVLLNGTPVGMWPHAGGCPVDPAGLHRDLTVFDPVYNPTPTRLVLNARKAGATAHGGLGMLVHQAIAAQRIWNPDWMLDAEAIAVRVLPALKRHLLEAHPLKILLIGFMGAGKSAVGRELARRLGIGYTDLDEALVEDAGTTIPMMFATVGESGFRAVESHTAKRILTRPGSEVVSAGGGLPTFGANRALIRETNTLVLYLDAPFATLWKRISQGPEGSRPKAAGGPEETEALYRQRAPVYRSFCDYRIVSEDTRTPAETAALLADALGLGDL